MKQVILSISALLLLTAGYAQNDSLNLNTMNQDALYERPFIDRPLINKSQGSLALGGYLEANTNYWNEDGIREGFSMEMRRFNIFTYASIGKHIKFLSELEFEHGTEEIELETAQIDIEWRPEINFRAGIIVAPLGAFNVNHDSPRYNFVERPLVSEQIIPSTYSDIGFGVFGQGFLQDFQLSYDVYVVNGLGQGIDDNETGHVYLPAGKNGERYGEDNNGSPAVVGRVAVGRHDLGELGLSSYYGKYNDYRIEGEPVFKARHLSLYALDFNTEIQGLEIFGEAAYVNMSSQAITRVDSGHQAQLGAYLELSYPIWKSSVTKTDKRNHLLEANIRLDYVDYNRVNAENALFGLHGNEDMSVAFALAYRPLKGTVIRANYRYHWIQDNIGNPLVRKSGIQFGIASYF